MEFKRMLIRSVTGWVKQESIDPAALSPNRSHGAACVNKIDCSSEKRSVQARECLWGTSQGNTKEAQNSSRRGVRGPAVCQETDEDVSSGAHALGDGIDRKSTRLNSSH